MNGTTPSSRTHRVLRMVGPALLAIVALLFVTVLTVVGGTAAALMLTGTIVLVLVVLEVHGMPAD